MTPFACVISNQYAQIYFFMFALNLLKEVSFYFDSIFFQNIYLFDKTYLICIVRKLNNLRPHGLISHGITSLAGPRREQSLPFPWGGGFVQVLIRLLSPLPQDLLHCDHCDHSEYPPSMSLTNVDDINQFY